MPHADVARRVLEVLYRFRRIIDSPDGDDSACIDCFEARRTKIDRFVENCERIEFVIPAFPAKSPNRTKVLGELPDLSERLALSFLQSLCDYISHFYPPGARITICSDGHVFGDVVGVSDATVTAYRESLANIIRTGNLTSLAIYGLDDAFGMMNYPVLRDILERDYSDTVTELKEKIRVDDGTRSLFNGIHRFLFEDAVGVHGGEVSRTKLRTESKERTYHTIRRSNAWSRVVAEKFPDAMRLSIHPQPAHSEKFGLQLMRTGDSWLTPWHGVALDDGRSVSLVKRSDAERVDATIVWREDRPSHFVAPHLSIRPEEAAR
ncbi:pyoverdine biosynthesis protein [Amycolatopsis albispora]|uniref:Pyoverdine biosynthesis protein n=1 Tax=Amycolatopsis albispora TaxID=1804986 RepID=A0A344LKX5_9PSEU|nr:pyoverdine biosynthesis protein [Amycolatopsis albispora]